MKDKIEGLKKFLSKSCERICTLEDRDKWLSKRSETIGASEIAVALGKNPWRTPLRLWSEKTERIASDDLSENEAVEWGNTLEPVIAQKFEDKSGYEVIDDPDVIGLYRSIEFPFLSATPDRFILTPEGKWGVLEIKTTSELNYDEWMEQPPEHIIYQLQQQILVCGTEYGAIAVLFGGRKFAYIAIERDNEIIKSICSAGKDFFEQIKNDDPPAPMAGDKNTISALYPTDDGEKVSLGGDFLALDAELIELKAQRADLFKRIEVAENKIKQAIGSNTYGCLSNGVVYSFKAIEMKPYSVEAKTIRTLRRKGVKNG